MKKFLITMLAVALCATAMAKVKVTGGDAGCMRERVTAVVVFDYSAATFDKEQSYEAWCGEDYGERVEKSAEAFVEGFNKKSKGLKIEGEESEAKYRITVKVGDMDQSMSFSCNWGQMSFKCSAEITITEIATGEVVCIVTVDEERGGCDYSPLDRITDCFNGIGKELAKKK